jgi:hypothetical protein
LKEMRCGRGIWTFRIPYGWTEKGLVLPTLFYSVNKETVLPHFGI